MKISAHDIAKGLVDTAFQGLNEQGLTHQKQQLEKEIQKELVQHKDRVDARLITPTGKAGTLADSFRKLLEKETGREVVIEEEADPSLLGGAILEYGDKRIDRSIRGALQHAERELSESVL